MRFGSMKITYASLAVTACVVTLVALLPRLTTAATEEEIARYRTIWNPFSAGPQLVSSADLQPKGQYFFRPYVYSEIGHGQFGNTWSSRSRSLPQPLSAINPQVEFSYGITNSVEFEMYVSEVSWWQSSGNGQPARSGHGLGDTTVFLKYRAIVQQPDTWWPTLTNAFYVSLPTSDWAGTPSIPGGFAPLGRLPSTHFGAPEFTESILFRKNIRPVRISGGIFYSYGPPSSNNGLPQYFGDIFQYRLAVEHFLDDAKGFAYAIEVLGLHGLPFRLDGHSVNTKPGSFGLVGVQPTVEYKFTDQIVGAAGVLLTLAGQNDIAAIYPNFSIYFYWSRSGRVIAR
ncbi:MAG TPA: hypothetical protein VNK46_09665 [Nitrospiraceae bacterium]|jgi:hypothetical protein|nr:hypothetical protein [Nitrospiraceae bacterium]